MIRVRLIGPALAGLLALGTLGPLATGSVPANPALDQWVAAHRTHGAFSSRPDSNAPAPHYSNATWNVNLLDIRHKLDAGQYIQAPLGNMGWRTLAMQPSNLFQAGQQKIQWAAPNGTILGESVLDLGTYKGLATDDARSIASLTVNRVGVYGFVRFHNTTYEFIPTSDREAANPANANVTVRWVGNSTMSPTDEALSIARHLAGPLPMLPVLPSNTSSAPKAPNPLAPKPQAGSTGGGTGGNTGGASPSGYTFCAKENQFCPFSGTADVAYGANGVYNYQYSVNGGIQCDNAHFGDPTYGTAKTCSYKSSNTVGPGPQGYSFCAYENNYCPFSGSYSVAYGANGNYAYKTLTGGTNCNNSVFGDPSYGNYKACYIAPASTSPGGPPGYSFCTSENSQCRYSGTRDLAYGANGAFIYKDAVSNGIDCTNAAFGGDPAYNTVKACYTSGGGTGGGTNPGPSDCHGSFPSGYSGYNAMCIKPVVDLRLQNLYADWASRITSAMNNQVSMWDHSAIIFKMLAFYAAGSNYSDSTTCGVHLGDFETHAPSDSVAAGYQLITSIGLTDCLGVAESIPECHLGQFSMFTMNRDIYGYNPDSSYQVGLASGHEIGHVWGQGPSHPADYDSYQGTYNIMATPFKADQGGYWFNAAGVQNVRDAARYGQCS